MQDFHDKLFNGAPLEGKRLFLKKNGILLPAIDSAAGKSHEFMMRLRYSTKVIKDTAIPHIPYRFDFRCGLDNDALICRLAIARKCKIDDLDSDLGINRSCMPDQTYMMLMIYLADPNDYSIKLYERFPRRVNPILKTMDEDDMHILFVGDNFLKKEHEIEHNEVEKAIRDELNTLGRFVRTLESTISSVATTAAKLIRNCSLNPELREFDQKVFNGRVVQLTPFLEGYRKYMQAKKEKPIVKLKR